MRTLVCFLSLFTLALFAMALPSLDAGGAARPDPLGDGPVRLAQAGKQAGKENAESVRSRSADAKSAARKSSNRQENTPAAAGTRQKRQLPLSEEMESEVRTFVRAHHRELLDVLTQLKNNVPKEYERAVRELSRQRQRLKQMEGRDRYAAELELWKAQSRARLLAAKVQMGDEQRNRDALREKLAEVYDLRAAIVQRERERTNERLKKLDDQLKSLQDDRDKNLEKQLLALTKTTQKRSKPVKTKARNSKSAPPAKKTPVKKTPAKTPA